MLPRFVAMSLLAITISPLGAVARAEVFHSRKGALAIAFPDADHVERKPIFLDDTQLAEVERVCGSKPESKLLTVYVGYKGGTLLGHAFIDTHTVRTLPETFMLVVDPIGKVQGIHILAFHEPPEYLPLRAGWGSFEASTWHRSRASVERSPASPGQPFRHGRSRARPASC